MDSRRGRCALLEGERRRLVLVIDQFEELFTLVDDGEARTFLDAITLGVRDAGDAIHVVVTLRADFYDRPLAEPTFGQLFADNVVSVVALGPEQLESAATLPARQLDIEVEPRLVGRLVADVAGQPNALPLFQYALTELFDARSGGVLDLATYERIGGVRKAVARRAESLYSQLDAAEQEAARQLFLRIATVSDDIVGRRRVPASELVLLDLDVVALGNVIDAFARYRLLALDRDPATGSPTVEVADEALLSEWHRLRDWIDQHRDDLAKQASFIAAVNEWETSGRDPGFLLQGKRLDAYQTWAGSTQLRMTVTEQDFLTAAVAARDADAAGEAEREQQRLRLQRRSRRQLVVLFVAAAVLAAVVAYPIITGPGDPVRIVAALETRRDESVFVELIARGVEQAGDDFGFEVDVVQPPYTDIASELREEVGGAGLVFGGVGMTPVLLDLADEFPDTTFVLVDATEAPLPNTVGLSFASEQGSFLVGAAAALESTTGKVGYIGANGSPLIESFRAGFEQGVAAVDPDVEVVSDLLFATTAPVGYVDAPIAYNAAIEMIDAGVDVIFVAAGESGKGVVDAVSERSTYGRPLWAIGVDTDQYFEIDADQREHVLTSMFKRIDVGIRSLIEAQDAGTLDVPGTLIVGAAEGAVGYTDTGGHLDQTTTDRLEALRTQLVDGTLVVEPAPATPMAFDPGPGLRLIDVESGSTTPLDVQPARIDDFDVSPDGTRLAGGPCCMADDRITIVDLDGGQPTVLAAAPIPAPGRSQYGAAWSPDGTRLLLQDRLSFDIGIGELVVYDLATDTAVTLADFAGRRASWWWLAPAFTPDGRDVVFQLARSPDETSPFDVWTAPAGGGEPELLVSDAAFPVPLPDGTMAVVSGMRGLYQPQTPTISIVDERGGHVGDLTKAESWVWQPRLLPDATRLAYIEGDPAGLGGRLRVVDLDSGTNSIVGRADVADWIDDGTLVVATYGP